MYFVNKDIGNDICIQADDFMYLLDYIKNMPYEYAVYA
jgi:hypothetical protein